MEKESSIKGSIDKQRLFRVLYRLDKEEISKLAENIKSNHEVVVVKKPEVTLAMIKMREPVNCSLFYIGETIVSNSIVSINGVNGTAVTMGMDLDKVLDMSIIDASMNAKLLEFKEIEEIIKSFEVKQKESIEKENGMFLKSKVNFESMDNIE